jgi:invasion protein IalB
MTTAALAAGFAWGAAAQAPPAPKAAPKAQPKSSPPPSAQPSAAQPQQPAGSPDLQVFYAPWSKFCETGPEANGKQVCFTGKYGRDESGMTAIMAMLIEAEGSPRKILRVTMPLGMQLAPGLRTVIDQGQPMEAPYVVCVINGCTVEYEASGELIGQLKTGRGLVVRGVDYQGNEITRTLPLSDFATSHDGPPTDPKLLAEQQQKLQELLQKRAEEARKKFEGQQQPAKK